MSKERQEVIIVERLMFGTLAGDDISFEEGDISEAIGPTAEKNYWTLRYKNGGVIMIGAGAAVYGKAVAYTEEAEIPEPKA